MLDWAQLLNRRPFSVGSKEKAELFATVLSELTKHHYSRCPQYKRILDVLGFDVTKTTTAEEIPFLPVRLFKEYDLISVDRNEIVKTMTSSGTSGQAVSKVFLDATTASIQSKVLVKIISDFMGSKRLPMMIIDSRSVVSNRALFSARGAGILGFSMLGRDIIYALDKDMNLDEVTVNAFVEKHRDEQCLLFGFTSIIWQHFYKPLAENGKRLPLDNSLMIHGGGWKRLKEIAVDSSAFNRGIGEVTGIQRIHNYYGMVEQTGSIFVECERGRMHCSNFSDIIVRAHADFKPCQARQVGLIQLLSLLPLSYPGHSLLSEDIGEITGEDDCPCGRLGKTFKVLGRVREAEVRGCSDTYGM